jgi:hypothetical protein
MKDLFNRTCGIYIPSFFSMKIDSLSFGENMNDRELSLFVHEYIHFLQSFTTLHGLERINSDFCVLMNMINWLKENSEEPINIPLSETVLSDITRNNQQISKLSWGDSEEIKYFDVIDIVLDPCNTILIDECRSVESVFIKYQTNELEEGICSFGAREIYEGMVYLIEQHITKDFESSPDFPYNTAYKVAEFLYPILTNDYRNILVLCNKALMFSNPGYEFVKMIKWIKEIKFVPESPDNLYYLLEQYREIYDINVKVDPLDNFKRFAEDVKSNMHIILNDEYFNDYHKWIDTIIKYAIKIRTHMPLFWIDIVDHGYVKCNTVFQSILHYAGAPLIETNKHEYHFITPNGCEDSTCLVYFKVFNQIFRILSMGDLQCNLMPWCHNPLNFVDVDSTCHKCPWNHSPKEGQLCTFKGIWQHWGLNNVKIEEK